MRTKVNVRKLWQNNTTIIVLWLVSMLIAIGTINVQSSSMVTAHYQGGSDPNSSYFLFRQLTTLLIGLFAMFFFSRLNYLRLSSMSWGIVIVTIILLLAVLIVGTTVNGSRRWISIGIQFQPAELAKLAAILITSWYISLINRSAQRPSIWQRYFFIVLVMAGLVEMEPDMGTAAIVIGIPFFLYIIAGLPKKELYFISGLGFMGVAFLCIFQTYRLKRLMAWYDPWADAQGVGYQITQSLKAIGSGGFMGMGLGQGLSKYAYLPESHTDFAFAIICQEGGFIAALVVITLFVLLGISIGKIAYNSVTMTGRVLSLGILFLIVGQALANMMMVIGLLPVIGVPLPFISYGGTSLLVNMSAIGILLNIDRCNRLALAKKNKDDSLIHSQNGARKPNLVRVK